MTAPPYMPLYVGDYLADTTHLEGVASGAYLHLLMAMWRAGGRLPFNDDKLRRLTKLTPAQWERVRDTVMEFFTRRGGSITHKRLSKELAKYHDKSVRLSEAGKRGQSERRNKNKQLGVSQAEATLKQPEPEPEDRIEGLLHSPSPIPLGASAAARPDGATDALRLVVVDKPPLAERKRQAAEAVALLGGGRKRA